MRRWALTEGKNIMLATESMLVVFDVQLDFVLSISVHSEGSAVLREGGAIEGIKQLKEQNGKLGPLGKPGLIEVEW